MKIRTATPGQKFALTMATAYLQQARASATHADCPSLLKKIRRALKSADGARRHMNHRLRRMNNQTQTTQPVSV